MTVDTFLNLLKNVVDKNKPLTYSRFTETIFTVDYLHTYKDTVYLCVGTLNRLNIRDIAVYLLNSKSTHKVMIVRPLGGFINIKDISNIGLIT